MPTLPRPYSTQAQRSPSPVRQPVAPIPVEGYLAQASLQPEPSQVQQPLLVILDMNGTLIYRKRRTFPPRFTKRPGLDPFLRYLFDNFKVMIWTSSQPQTVTDVLDKLLPPEMKKQLVGVWSRKDLDLTPKQYKEKVQVYKRLDKVWRDENIQSQYPRLPANDNTQYIIPRKKKKSIKLPRILGEGGQVWDQTNTILVDDSRLKAAGQPHNIIEIPEFTNDPNVDEIKNLTTVMRQLDILSRQKDVSRKLREWNQRRPDASNDSSRIDTFWEKELVLSSFDIHALESTTPPEETDTPATKAPEATDYPFLNVEQLVSAARKSLNKDLHISKNGQSDEHRATADSRPRKPSTQEPKESGDAKPKLTKGQKRAAKRAAARLRAEGATGINITTDLSQSTRTGHRSAGFLDDFGCSATATGISSGSDISTSGGVALPVSKNETL
ncbi:NIF domain-containing protein [Arthroderma uncinatum]|uniref:NIF domain-containing protein n=1 Tax=Arthroderma uncinatum TaxID=74035 RepID=UPI00144AB77B|nr:NIF domain-containing protein [Arthroderma uncinatum]KAF3483683.1 NIF domain-containing protein [Arthroderma uncinatum]